MYIIKDEVKNKLSKMGHMNIPGSNLEHLEGYIKDLCGSSYNNEDTNSKLDLVISEFEKYYLNNKLEDVYYYQCYTTLLKELDNLATHYYSNITHGNKLSSVEEQNLYYELLNNLYFVASEKNNNNDANKYFEGISYKKSNLYSNVQIMFWKLETNNIDKMYKDCFNKVYEKTNIKFDTTYKCETYLNQVDLDNIKIFNNNITNKKSHTIV